ncbi:growth/differentiation factor 9-like [Corythoichthys intestinalis]|uniref:growth/differentiation factor 9-like n=1 Tax=Corythoichthys intestinalis TaxID=161448 RepID=UPI0025A67486|nr:growth/differentiation factor 9-like [Corythoichthys intestinalis]
MLISVTLSCFRAVLFLLLVSSSCPPLVRCSVGRTDSVSYLSQSAYGTIFSPLFKALSEHGGSRWWNQASVKNNKAEHKYMKYLTAVFKTNSRVQRTSRYDVVRLIKPQEQCFAKSNKENFTLDLSYSLDQVREKEQLMKATLLYSLAYINSVCFLSIKEQEHSNKCPLCPGIYRALNFTADDTERGNWLEVDITSLLLPPSKFPKNVHLHINVICPKEQQAGNAELEGPLQFTLGSPPLLLYLHDNKKTSNQTLPPPPSANEFNNHIFKALRAKKRQRRASANSKRGDKSLDINLPELLPTSKFPTSYCALYDFRVQFSQLGADHWIVYPPRYNPRYCRGICPRVIGDIYGSPRHTMLQNIIYEKLKSSVPWPSCIPSHYSPLSVWLQEKDGTLVYKEFEEMVATRCTCR